MLSFSLISSIAAAESASDMQSAAEAAQEVSAGRWQGNWLVLREDARIRTRGGAETLRLHVFHDAGSEHAQVQWIAGRAICEDPLGEPCEWVGASGESLRVPVTDDAMYLLLPLSADTQDAALLHVTMPTTGEGLLLSLSGGLRYRVRLIAASDPD